MKKFYQLSYGNGQDTKVILASTKYEAIGFYLLEEVGHVCSDYLDRVQERPPEYVVAGKTLEDIWKEKDDWIFPKTIISL